MISNILWGVRTPDGWFASNDVNTDAGNFNHVRKNIYVSK